LRCTTKPIPWAESTIFSYHGLSEKMVDSAQGIGFVVQRNDLTCRNDLG